MANIRKVTVWGKIDPETKKLVEQISGIQGISISEYIRMLITADLDKRTVFTDQLKAKIAE